MIQGALRTLNSTFFANPNAQRDFRAQMRGRKAPVLWGTYLGIFVILASIFYASTSAAVPGQGIAISQLQERLQQFFQFILGILDLAVFLAAPVLAASLVVAEYDRRSIDLVLSSPMKPANFLIGKLISSWRNVWMMLILAVPLSAVCVVLGGATWGEVLESSWLIALRGLVFCSIALPIALITKKIVPAIFWSLFCCLALQLVMGLVLITSISSSIGMAAPGSPRFVPPLLGLTMFSNSLAMGAQTMVLGIAMPAWLASSLGAALVAAICVMGGSAVMDRFGSRTSCWFRVIGVVLGAVMSFLIATGSNLRVFGSGSPATMPFIATAAGVALSVACLPLLGVICHTACYHWYGERREAPGPLFALKDTFRGGPSGALPYILLYVFACAAAAFLGEIAGMTWASLLLSGAPSPGPTVLPPGSMPSTMIAAAVTDATTLYLYGFLWVAAFAWLAVGCYRWASAFGRPGAFMARRTGTAILAGTILLPIPLVLLAAGSNPDGYTLFALVPAAGPFMTMGSMQDTNLVITIAVALVLSILSEAKRIQVAKVVSVNG